ncbi:hypothetical protein PUNSTDRAFT_143622 [Punctularia strigosozonata HHB-11173 SS5]|uniref:uncharacterized protein n=1 Tax=Punctularia strigosozonata (strain HHB-11173) TaxID=741275 RepID=UPI0004416AB6|nr:uncharacterized protein PUNSTDRAFT_143622 [Punctularia strigosozonata HHB-11173 SS5]EIN08967.1 hypothetical protein PUNSTDRAFT_143622 [Punctularia strigosozonata HHB-11173 SS5]
MSHFSHLNSLATPTNLCIGVGLSASSFLYWGNLGLVRCGPFAIMNTKTRDALGIRPAQALQIWEDAYDRGAVHFFPSGVIGFLAFLTAGILRGSGDHPRSALFFIASAANFAVGFFTFTAIMPLNNHLKSILRSAEKRSGKKNAPELESEKEAEETLGSIDKWKTLNAVRMGFALFGWTAATVAILL